MLENLIKSVFGDPDEKKINRYKKILEQVKEKEKKFKHLTLDDLKSKTEEFKKKFEGLDFKKEEDSKKIRQILDDIKVEAIALVKQATKLINGQTFELPSGKSLTWNMIPYDVQIIGGLAIHEGNIAEMKTGEGKTLVATIPAYLNALTGNPVHIVTVNDYLARRDSEEMGILYNALGLKVGVITHNQGKRDKKEAYNSDIVYATNNELGFDYLRDNMVATKENQAIGPLFFAIIDEVDSILIDEARTPLIISMPDNEPTSKYLRFAELAKLLEDKTHYKIDEKQKSATLTEDGIKKIEEMLKIENIYIGAHFNDIHHIENALRAHAVYKKDKDYIVMNDEVMIVDEHTGRVLPGRRYSDGLHQALEAKEKVEIQRESKTLASITFQNYFRMYWKLSGMTGTAKTEEEEFYKVYALETLVIPTNRPVIREDRPDLLFKNEKGKFDFVVKMIKELNEKGQPMLVGTVSVDKSEYLSQRLKDENIPHNVLNAKHHEKEAEIIAKAGEKGSVTIATNMAGRGTDIKLGEGVVDLGGLCIIGTEKHETRRIDNQLRGRAGRQGDPGITQFLISPNDDIMRIFGGDKLFGIFNSPMFASLPDEEPLTQSSMLTKKVTSVQKQVEGHNFDIRKHVLEYDDVINKHREIIYGRRNKILESENIDDYIKTSISNQLAKVIESVLPDSVDSWDREKLKNEVNEFVGIDLINDTVELDDINGINNKEEMKSYVSNMASLELDKIKTENFEEEQFYDIERKIVLQSIDELWMNHIDSMSRLREEVAFEGFAQRNPLVVYKEKAFEKFDTLINNLEFKIVKAIYSVKNNIRIEQMNIDDGDIVLNAEDIEKALNNFAKDNNIDLNSTAGNPLFMGPESSGNNPSTKIRV
ncbi:MAG: preprotein translocase subunit SecA [Candidatus Gracilibacteria bacterium]|nr:preprotein translocase subunit SecA [Candidatus Gracilibacteria bacterium]